MVDDMYTSSMYKFERVLGEPTSIQERYGISSVEHQ